MTARQGNPLPGCGVEPRAEQGSPRIDGNRRITRDTGPAQAADRVTRAALAYRRSNRVKLDRAEVADATGLQLPTVTVADGLAVANAAALGLLLGAKGVDDGRVRLVLLALLAQCWRGDLAVALAVHRATDDPAPWWCWTLPSKAGGPAVDRAWLAQRAACTVSTVDRVRAALKRAGLLDWPKGGSGHPFGLSYAVNVGRLLAVADLQAADRTGARQAVKPSKVRARRRAELAAAKRAELAAESAGGCTTHGAGGVPPMVHPDECSGAPPMVQGGAPPMVQGGAPPVVHHKHRGTSTRPIKHGSAALTGAAPASRSVAPAALASTLKAEDRERPDLPQSPSDGAGSGVEQEAREGRDPHAGSCPPDHPLAALLATADADAQTRPALRRLWSWCADLPPSRPPPARIVNALATELQRARRAGEAPTLAAVCAAVQAAAEQPAPRALAAARKLAASTLADALACDVDADRLTLAALAALAPAAPEPEPLALPLAAGGRR